MISVLPKKIIFGLMLSTLILTASLPVLIGIQQAPEDTFQSNVITLSQLESGSPITESMANDIRMLPNVTLVSPEIYTFSVINDAPVIMRGVQLEPFLAMEDAEIIKGDISREKGSFMTIGKDLSERLDVKVNDSVPIIGSTYAMVGEMKIGGIYDKPVAADEALISLDYARHIAGLAPDAVSIIRVKTNNINELIAFLEEDEKPIVITKPSTSTGAGSSTGTVVPINSNITEEEKLQRQLAIKYLDTSGFKESGGSYISLFAQEGANSIGLVITGFIVMDAALMVIGASAIVSRAIIERRRDFGIIFAIGADKNYQRFQVYKALYFIAIPSSAIGTIMGYYIANAISNANVLLMFGQKIIPYTETDLILSIFLASVLIIVISGMILNDMFTARSPSDLIRETEKLHKDIEPKDIEELLRDDNGE